MNARITNAAARHFVNQSMSPLGRPRRQPKLLDFNGLCNRKGILQFNAEIPDGAVHFGVPK